MLKIKKTDLEINIIEKEFRENAYIDPGYHSDPLYKYQSFYIKKGEELERCGITKLSIGPAMMGKFERNHEKIDLRCYSKQSGFFELSEISTDVLIYYKGEDEDNYSILRYGYIYEEADIQNTMIICSELSKPKVDSNSYNLKIIINGEARYVIENIHRYNYISNIDNEIIYIREANRKRLPYEFYSFNYKTGETIFLGKYPTFNLNARQWTNSRGQAKGGIVNKITKNLNSEKRKILDEDNIYFYFSIDGTAGSHVLMEFFKTADLLERIDNISQLDVTENYVAGFNKQRLEDIQFTCYMIEKYNIPGLKIFGYSISDIIDVIDFGLEPYKYYSRNKLGEHYYNLRRIYDYLKDKYSMDDEDMVEHMAYEYGIFSVDSLISRMGPYIKMNPNNSKMDWSAYGYKNLIKHPKGLTKNEVETYNFKIQKLYQDSLLNDESKVRWKSEFSLFKLVQSHFTDAIYQYRAPWLSLQSLDIFIPSIDIAIEYQGEQHYKAIDVFGGKEALKETKNRDKRKRKLCRENNIKLIEWKYDLPINIMNLSELFKEYNVEVFFEENILV